MILEDNYSMTYLVTGGAGFIGTNYCLYFLSSDAHKNDRLIVVDKMSKVSNDYIKNIADNKRLIFIKENICNYKKIEEIFIKYHIDYVINFAAESHVDRSIKNPSFFVKNNVESTLNLLKLSLKYHVIRFHQISTDEVYGSTELNSKYLFKEDDRLEPSNPYSASKASSDLLTLSFFKTYGLNVTISRSSNNFGPYQYKEKLIPLVIDRALKNKKIPIYGSGLNVRDRIYVLDNCEAIDYIVKNGIKGNIYNISTHNELSNIEVVKIVLNALGKPYSLIEHVKDRLGHDARYGISTEKLSKLGFNFKNQLDFLTQIKEFVKEYN